MSKKSTVKLDTEDKIKRFVEKIKDFPEDIKLGVDKYLVDAKSVLGVKSLDTQKPLDVHIDGDGKRISLILSELEEFRGD